VRFTIDRRWATLAVAVVLGAAGGTLIGLVTAPAPGEDVEALAPVEKVAPSTTRRERSRFAGESSTTTRPRRRALPAATAGLSPASAPTRPTVRPTTTTTAPTTSTTVAPGTTTTTTTGDDTTTTSSTSTVSSTTSTTTT
jgi:hypothetical protein